MAGMEVRCRIMQPRFGTACQFEACRIGQETLSFRQIEEETEFSITSDWITLGGIVAILVFLWNLHRDMADLRERMARLEGLFEGFTGKARQNEVQ